MHFLEALLANYEVFGDEIFIDTAKDIVELFLDKFLCPATGAIAEYFEDDLSTKLYSNSYSVEPGHIFEWVWLLQKFDSLLQKETVGKMLLNPIYKKLFEYTDNYAVNSLNGLVFDELSGDGKVLSYGSRIWPQTERIRAEVHCRQGNTKQEIQALNSFKVYINNIPRGLWHEQFDRDGISTFPVSRATTLYHLTTGFFSCLSW